MGIMSDVDPSPVPAPADPAGAPDPLWHRAGDAFARWRDGEPAAMDELVRMLTPVLWHVVRAYGLERTVAEDVVQSTWLTLVRRHHTIADARAVSGWLTTTARREAWRVAQGGARLVAVDDPVLEARMPRAGSAEDDVHRTDRDRRLWNAVGTLDERCRRLLRIVAFDDRPDYAGIARDLAMPVGSIGPTRRRCLGKLRTALERDGWSEA